MNCNTRKKTHAPGIRRRSNAYLAGVRVRGAEPTSVFIFETPVK